MADAYVGHTVSQRGPYTRAVAVTPNDSTDLADVCSALFIGGAGNVVVITQGGDTVTLTGVLAGTIYPIRCSRVRATSTTATNIVALR